MLKRVGGARSATVRTLFWLGLFCLFVHTTFAAVDINKILKAARAKAETEVLKRKAAEAAAKPTTTTGKPGAPKISMSLADGAGVGSTRRRGSLASKKFSKVHGKKQVPKDLRAKAELFGIAASFALGETQTNASAVSEELKFGFRAALIDICPIQPICDQHKKYREYDGTCNNLDFPLQGAQFTPQARWLLAAYSDSQQKEAPRMYSVTGQRLPSARHISNIINRGLGENIYHNHISQFFPYFGQFLIHEMVLTPIHTNSDDSSIECCDIHGGFEPDPHPECFPIRIPISDPFYPSSKTCMNFVRSLGGIDNNCGLGQRQQLNLVTSYIDASVVYGSTRDDVERLRDGEYDVYASGKRSGKMKTKLPNHYYEIPGLLPQLPEDPHAMCDLQSEDEWCMDAGDPRNDMVPQMTMFHTIFVREHNRIATMLRATQPNWSNDTLFEETRRIIGAVLQHITYNEFMPLLLGPVYAEYYDLLPTHYGYNYVYNSDFDASIRNEFAAGAARFAHSMIPNFIAKKDQIDGRSFLKRNLEYTFFAPNMAQQVYGVQRIARYTAAVKCPYADSRVEQSVRNKLFEDPFFDYEGLDLAAIDIQRARDHGLSSYNAYREMCGLVRYHSFQDVLQAINSFQIPDWVDHPYDAIVKLQQLYSHIDDVDLITGAMSEIHVPGGVVGRTFACLLGNQFRNSKFADRFHYENPLETTGFSLDQLNSIKQITMAKIMCVNMNTPYVQPNIFKLPDNDQNRLRACASLPDINIYHYWSGNQMFSGPAGSGAFTFHRSVADTLNATTPKKPVAKFKAAPPKAASAASGASAPAPAPDSSAAAAQPVEPAAPAEPKTVAVKPGKGKKGKRKGRKGKKSRQSKKEKKKARKAARRAKKGRKN